MNCIFLTIGSKEEIKNIYLILESIYIYGKLNSTTDILIYTTTEIMELIKESNLYNSNIKFEINDNELNVINSLGIFKLSSSSKYSKIIYLCNNIIVNGDINKLFNLITADKIYVLEEGDINTNSLFENELDNYEDKSSFTTNIILFNNSDKIKKLFNDNYQDKSSFIYNAIKNNLFDNKILKDYISLSSTPTITATNEVLYYQNIEISYELLKNKLIQIKEILINDNIIKSKIYINSNLIPIINDSREILEPSIFTLQHTAYNDTYINKAKNICNIVLNSNIKNIIEVGFNAGFSTLLMLITNPDVKITCIDLGTHTYTSKCYNRMKEEFGDRINLIIGDSIEVLPMVNDKYDLIHIDGGISHDLLINDTIHAYRLAHKGTIIMMNNINMHMLWHRFKTSLKLKNVNINIYDTNYSHEIYYV